MLTKLLDLLVILYIFQLTHLSFFHLQTSLARTFYSFFKSSFVRNE